MKKSQNMRVWTSKMVFDAAVMHNLLRLVKGAAKALTPACC
jgi:hypothetical protein